jgi:hypothetical protein
MSKKARLVKIPVRGRLHGVGIGGNQQMPDESFQRPFSRMIPFLLPQSRQLQKVHQGAYSPDWPFSHSRTGGHRNVPHSCHFVASRAECVKSQSRIGLRAVNLENRRCGGTACTTCPSFWLRFGPFLNCHRIPQCFRAPPVMSIIFQTPLRRGVVPS